MTAILNIPTSTFGARAARLLLVGASGLALATPLAANELLFTNSQARPETGQRIEQRTGVTQIALTGGAVVSIVDAADYRINADGSVDLYEGTITIAAGPTGEVVVRMPDGVEGRVGGAGSAGNFTAREGREASGHALTGTVQIGRAGVIEQFEAGAMWRVEAGRGVRRVVANAAQAQPGAPDAALADAAGVVPIGGDAGPVAAALNGIPQGFGDQLAGAGASSDIIAAARRIEGVAGNPVLDAFPSGDLALLVAAAAQLEGAYGGTPFPQAQADIIRTYLRFLGGGGAGSAFLTSYSRFAADYLDLIRAGGLPSSFVGAGPQDIDAWLAYIRRTGAIGSLAARDRVLAETYLAFLASGGNRDAFARSFTDLTVAYFAFVRGGGDPAAFTGANAATLAQTIAFLRDSGLTAQLGAADRALIDAYLANGGLAFAGQYRAAFADYSAFLASGRRPSEYTAVDQATLRGWLETLSNTGLLTSVLGERAGFFADYLAFLRAGGAADGFARLPANVFAGYAVQLDSYFAFLATGRRPSEFTQADIATLQAWLLELQAAGALDRFLGNRAAFFANYAAFVAAGGSFDAFAGLPANIFAGYAVQLDAYFAFLAEGRLPSEFATVDLPTLQAWLVQLQAAGALERFLGNRAAFFSDYAAFIAEGGSVDTFALLPANVFAGYATNLRAFFDFLAAGGVPSGYSLITPAQIRDYIAALEAAGATGRFLGDLAAFYRDYAVFLAGGGNPDLFAGLPVPPDFPAFAAALNAYAAFLQRGGLPSNYTAQDLANLRGFIDALVRAGQLQALLGANAELLSGYFAYIAGGGSPNGFSGLPVYASYVSALNAYFAFLQGGGLPSAYTALDQATIEAYLAALANVQGGLAAIAGLDPFFVEYFVFIAGGGNPDVFAGLPGNGGGGSPTGPSTQLVGVNAWVFGADALRVNTAADVTLDTEGRISAVTLKAPSGNQSFTFDPASGALREFGRIGDDVAWSRYLVGRSGSSTNLSQNVLVGAPATQLPTAGTVNYRLVGGTAPTDRNGALDSTGWFTGNLAVLFGATPLIGLDFEVLSGSEGYRVTTQGGAANPGLGGLALRADNTFENQAISLTGLSASSCTAFCQAQVFGGAFGAAAKAIGFTYSIFDQAAFNSIQGIAVFGTEGTALPGLGTAPPPGAGGGTPPAIGTVADFDTSVLVTAALSYGEQGFTRTARTADSDVSSTGVLNRIGTFSRGNATGDQIIGDEYAIIGRWINGTSNLGSRTYTSTANDAVHWAIASVANRDFTLTGRIEYDLLGATTPTYSDGRTAPGTFDGSLVIDWQSAAQIALTLTGKVTMPDAVYDWSFTSPNFATRLQGVFETNATVNGRACANNDCQAAVSYQFGGAKAGERFAMNYNIDLFAQNLDIGGSALFGAPGTYDPAAFGLGGGNGGGGSGAVSAPPYSGTVAGLRVVTSRLGGSGNGVSSWADSTATFDADGNIATYTNSLGSTAGSGQPLADADNEAGSIAGGIAWARFLDPVNATGPIASSGVHTILGTPAVNLPASGRVAYTMIGGTRPTTNQGTADPGKFSGSMAVDFATRRVGINLNVAIADRAWQLSTTGGTANPADGGFQIASGGTAFSGVPTVTGLNAASCTASCNAGLQGALFGPGASHAGIAYVVFDNGFVARGSGVFAAPGAAGTPVPQIGAAPAGAIAPTSGAASAVTVQDWSRWAGASSGSAETARLAELAPVTGGPAAPAVIVDPADREGAIRQAERLMGGMITFAAVAGEAP